MRVFEGTRYEAARIDGHRFYLTAAAHGVHVSVFSQVLVLLGLSLGALAINYEVGTSLTEIIRLNTDFRGDYKFLLAAALLLAPLVGLLEAKILNIFFAEEKAFGTATAADYFERMVLDAMASEEPLLASLEDGKVYVGFAFSNWNPDLGERKHLQLLPLMSGYRNSEAKLTFTTFYDQLYELPLRGGAEADGVDGARESNPFNPEDFVIVIPISRVISLRKFDTEAYQEFNPEIGSKGSERLSVSESNET